MIKRLVWFSLFFILASPLYAHGPTPKRISETITINAPADDVWAVLKDFSAIASWHPAVKESKGSGGNKSGGERIIMLEKGVITDSLDEYDETRKLYAYRLAKEDVKAFPVSFYSAEISAKAEGGKTVVEWIGRFYRADTGNFPPEDLNDKTAISAMTNFFKTGLAGLKAKIEGK